MKLKDIEERIILYYKSKDYSQLDDDEIEMREKIWKEIKSKKVKPHNFKSFWLTAASILILMSLGMFFYNFVQYKNNEIIALQNENTVLKNMNEGLKGQVKQTKNELLAIKNRTPEIKTIVETRVIYKEREETANTHQKEQRVIADSSEITAEFKREVVDSTIIEYETLVDNLGLMYGEPDNYESDSVKYDKINEEYAEIKIAYGDLIPGDTSYFRPWKMTIKYNY